MNQTSRWSYTERFMIYFAILLASVFLGLITLSFFIPGIIVALICGYFTGMFTGRYDMLSIPVVFAIGYIAGAKVLFDIAFSFGRDLSNNHISDLATVGIIYTIMTIVSYKDEMSVKYSVTE